MVYSENIVISTKGYCDIIDITGRTEKVVVKSGIRNGLITLSVPGSTASVTTIEYEPGLVEDIKNALENIASEDAVYEHDKKWGDGNGFSHVRAALMGASRSFPVNAGKIVLGTWQQIVLMDFDNKPREREIFIQVMGE